MASLAGIAMGSAAQSMAQARQTRLSERQLGLEERALGLRETLAKQEAAFNAQKLVREDFQRLTESAVELAKRGGLDNSAYEIFRDRITATADLAGMDSGQAALMFDTAIARAQLETPEEVAKREGRAEGIKTASKTSELRAAGLHGFTQLPPDAVKNMGLPENSVVQQNNETGEIKITHIPEPGDVEFMFDEKIGRGRIVTEEEMRSEPTRYKPMPDTGKESEKEAAIARIMEAYALRGTPITRSDAIDIVDGVVALRDNPVTGETSLVNKVTGAKRQLFTELPGEEAPVPTVPTNQTLAGTAARGNVAGIVPSTKEVGSAVTGQFPGGAVATDVIRDRQTFRTAGQEIKRALSINPRFPEGEMKRIEREINIEPKTWDSTEALLTRLSAVKQSMEIRLANERRAAQSRSLSAADRQAARSAVDSIERFLELIGEPEDYLSETQGTIDGEREKLIDKWLQESP